MYVVYSNDFGRMHTCILTDTNGQPSLHIQAALVVPRARNLRLRHRLARTFVELSTAYRDMSIELTVTRVDPQDVGVLRNLMQAVIRALLAMKIETKLFDARPDVAGGDDADEDRVGALGTDTATANAAGIDGQRAARVVIQTLRDPTRNLLAAMRESLQLCDVALMTLLGFRRLIDSQAAAGAPSDVHRLPARIHEAMAAFDSTLSRTHTGCRPLARRSPR